jgi:hypothetical protein
MIAAAGIVIVARADQEVPTIKDGGHRLWLSRGYPDDLLAIGFVIGPRIGAEISVSGMRLRNDLQSFLPGYHSVTVPVMPNGHPGPPSANGKEYVAENDGGQLKI